MKNETLKQEIEIIISNLEKKESEFTSCLTVPGKKFQKELSDLVRLVRKTYSIPLVFQLISTFLDSLYEKITKENKEVLDEEYEVITKKNASIIKKRKFNLRETINDIGITNFMQKFEHELPIYLESLNSHYILALFAYMDHYLSSIYELIVTSYSDPKIRKLLLNLRIRGNLNFQLDFIFDNLKLLSKKKFKELLQEKTWQSTFKKIIKFRNVLAHEEPKVKKQVLFKEFPNLYEKATELTKNDFADDIQKNTDFDFLDLDKLHDIVEPNVKTMFLLIEIGKECYSYISFFDILIDNFLKS